MMFGMGQKGTTNLITKALQAVGKQLETIPDPTQIHYHLPKSMGHPQVQSGASLNSPQIAPSPFCSIRSLQQFQLLPSDFCTASQLV